MEISFLIAAQKLFQISLCFRTEMSLSLVRKLYQNVKTVFYT